MASDAAARRGRPPATGDYAHRHAVWPAVRDAESLLHFLNPQTTVMW